MLLFLVSCEKDIVTPESNVKILEVTFSEISSVKAAQQIAVKICKPTPCHEVTNIIKTLSGTIFTYDIIVASGAEVCVQVIEEKTVNVIFDPSSPGEYTVKFLLNGQLFETRTITITE